MLNANTQYDYFTYQVALIALPLLLYICMFVCVWQSYSYTKGKTLVQKSSSTSSCLPVVQIHLACMQHKKCCLLYDLAFYSAFSFINHCLYSISNTFNHGNIKNVVNLKKILLLVKFSNRNKSYILLLYKFNIRIKRFGYRNM